MYTVRIYNDGIYNNVNTNERIFYSFRRAKRFSDVLDKIKAENTIFKVSRISRGHYVGYYPYYKQIKMFNYEIYDELSPIKRVFYRVFKRYDSKKVHDYLHGEDEI